MNKIDYTAIQYQMLNAANPQEVLLWFDITTEYGSCQITKLEPKLISEIKLKRNSKRVGNVSTSDLYEDD